jgi:limonene-1,2-epoxide hydrolase
MGRKGLAIPVLALLLAGCGGSDHKQSGTTPKRDTAAPVRSATREQVRVIRGWVDALRAGHVDAAARFFAVPAIVQNDSPVIRLGTRAQVRAFNAALPCGARLVKTFVYRRYVAATFVLTERPGGTCGNGTGRLAATAFLIRHGKIEEWQRVPLPSEGPAPTPAPRQPHGQSS